MIKAAADAHENIFIQATHTHTGPFVALDSKDELISRYSEDLKYKLDEVYKDQIIANVGGHSTYEYVETVKKIRNGLNKSTV